MLYREAGQFRTSYAQDAQLFPLRQDRIGMVILLIFGFVVVPLVADAYWLTAILVPWLVFSLVALGQNILSLDTFNDQRTAPPARGEPVTISLASKDLLVL